MERSQSRRVLFSLETVTQMGRAGQPSKLGSIYVQLAGADANYATGQVYGSAGGLGQP